MTAITDRNANRIDLDCDAGGQPTAIRHSGGYHLDLDADRGRITEVRLRMPKGQRDLVLVRFRYDEAGNLTGVVNSSGRSLHFDYDGNGRMAGWEDRNGVSYRYTYDGHDRCVAGSGTGGCLNRTFAYGKSERTTVEADSLGHATTYHANDLLQIDRVVDPLGGTTSYEWDPYDRLLAETDPLGRTTRFTYDPAGNLSAITRPDGTGTTLAHNDLGLPVTIGAPDGALWHRAYDERGNLVSQTDPLGATTTYARSSRGHLTAVTDALGFVAHVETDAAGLPVAVTGVSGATTRYERDPLERVIAVTDALGGVTRLGWTTEGKLASRTLPDGARQRWVYDPEGNLVEEIDPLGQVTTTEIAPFDLPRSQIGPDGAPLTFGYDTELRLVAVTNPQGLTWRYEYDPAGNLVRETDFNGRILTYAYDAAGQLTRRSNGAGETTRFARDALGQVVEQRSDGAGTTFSYDPLGRLTRATGPDCELTFERDALGRVLAEACNGRAVLSTYDALGRRLQRQTPSGHVSTWTYGPGDEPLTLTTGSQRLELVSDALGREAGRRFGEGEGIAFAQTWDLDGRLLGQSLTAPAPGSGEDRRAIQRRFHGYRADGYPVAVDDLLSGRRDLDLDPAGHVTAVRGSSGAWTERYGYDLAGNVTSARWVEPPGAAPGGPAPLPLGMLDAQGEREYAGTLIRRAGNVHCEHDGQGRLVLRQEKRPSAKPRTWHYGWDADDRLTGVVTPGGEHWRYRYDPLGRRIAKERLAPDGERVLERVDFSWDGLVLAEELRSMAGDPGAGLVAGPCTTWDWDPGSFRPVAQRESESSDAADQDRAGERFFVVLTDPVGTPTELVDAQGNLVWRRRATLWGHDIAAGPGHVSCPLGLPGQYHDPESGLAYNLFRHYDPATARYASPDPLGLAAGPNPYAYAPNPTRWIDPLGLAPCHPLFSQTTASRTFGHGPFRGRALADVVADLRAGKITPARLPVDVIVRNGETIGLNTRSMLTLRRAGIEPSDWIIRDVTGAGQWERRLTERLMKNELTGGIEHIRITGPSPNMSYLR